jgi:hypothetical protein
MRIAGLPHSLEYSGRSRRCWWIEAFLSGAMVRPKAGNGLGRSGGAGMLALGSRIDRELDAALSSHGRWR